MTRVNIADPSDSSIVDQSRRPLSSKYFKNIIGITRDGSKIYGVLDGSLVSLSLRTMSMSAENLTLFDSSNLMWPADANIQPNHAFSLISQRCSNSNFDAASVIDFDKNNNFFTPANTCPSKFPFRGILPLGQDTSIFWNPIGRCLAIFSHVDMSHSCVTATVPFSSAVS